MNHYKSKTTETSKIVFVYLRLCDILEETVLCLPIINRFCLTKAIVRVRCCLLLDIYAMCAHPVTDQRTAFSLDNDF